MIFREKHTTKLRRVLVAARRFSHDEGSDNLEMEALALRNHSIWPVDWLHISFLSASVVLLGLHFDRLEVAAYWLVFDVASLAVLIWVIRTTRLDNTRRATLLRLFHGYATIPIFYFQVGFMVRGLVRYDYAAELEGLDRMIFFGLNPLEQLEKIASPYLTELMDWTYISFWFLPLIIVILALDKDRPTRAAQVLFSVILASYLCLMGFFFVPASGPNIHNNFGPLQATHIRPLLLYRFSSDLPGLWASGFLRELVFALEMTKLTVFPSGHVAITLVCMVHAFRIRKRYGWLFFPIGLGNVFSTLYLRYHYVVDVLAGAAVAWLCVMLLEWAHRPWESRLFAADEDRRERRSLR